MTIGLDNHIQIFKNKLAELKSGSGSIICIEGESGFGKTHFLKVCSEMLVQKNSLVKRVYIDTQAPIGNFNIGSFQPLLPFSRAIEQLLKDPDLSPEKRFFKNIGMTLLATLPGTDIVFYAVKEIGRDWRQFKSEKNKIREKNINLVTQDYYDTLCSYSNKTPLILLMDDMHWCDVQSVELLNLLAREIRALPIMIVLTYQQSILDRKGMPLAIFTDRHINKTDGVIEIRLESLTATQISLMCKSYLPNYTQNNRFETWLHERTLGVPAIVCEYLNYFKQEPPFDENGEFNENLIQTEFIPTSVHAAFTNTLSRLTDEERNILSICSAEGREFTALVVSDLLNTDVLTTIKKLRSLQIKTGIIKSNGANVRYGVKTTTYQFNQAYYHKFFEQSLEYEEHIALHGQIAALLKQKYDEAESEEVRGQIAPFLAAHSAESGDEDTAKSMILYTAQAASKYGSSELIQSAYQNYIDMKNETDAESEIQGSTSEDIAFRELVYGAHLKSITTETETAEKSHPTVDYSDLPLLQTDFKSLRNAVVRDFLESKFDAAINLSESYFASHDKELNNQEKAQLLAILSRSYIETGELLKAEDCIKKALGFIGSNSDAVTESIVLNAAAILRSEQKRHNEAFAYLQQAAKKSIALPEELRIITIANIASIMKEYSPQEAAKYLEAARKMSGSLNYQELRRELA